MAGDLIPRPPLEGELLGPEGEERINPHHVKAESCLMPDIFHKDGTLNEDALRENRRRMDEWFKHQYKSDIVWLEELRKNTADIEQESNRNMWGALVAPLIALVVVAVAMIAGALNR